MRYYFFISIILISFCCHSIHAQHKIDIEFENYNNDTLIIGYYLGEKTLVLDTLFSSDQTNFIKEGTDTIPEGMYMLLCKPDNSFVQFIINEEDQDFKINVKGTGLGEIQFDGHQENEMFIEYQEFINEMRNQAEPLRAKILAADSTGANVTLENEQLDLIDLKVKEKQKYIHEKFEGSVLSMVLKANEEVVLPEFSGTEEEVRQARYLHYKKHYFDAIEMGNPATLRTPFIHKKITYYIEKLTPLAPDSIITSIDYILDQLSPATDSYQYYLGHYLNTYANSKVIGMDAVYVHMADKYYSPEKTPWVTEENMLKIQDHADGIRPILIGKTASNIKLKTPEGKEISIDEIDYEYLVLLFWAPDCGHCNKAMPDVVNFYEAYKDKGVEILAICTKHQEKLKTCWEVLEEKNMTNFINAGDELHLSAFKLKYNIKTTPKIFILDKERKILIKDIGAEHLGPVMDEILMREAENLPKGN